jgi:hypothetical protein
MLPFDVSVRTREKDKGKNICGSLIFTQFSFDKGGEARQEFPKQQQLHADWKHGRPSTRIRCGQPHVTFPYHDNEKWLAMCVFFIFHHST